MFCHHGTEYGQFGVITGGIHVTVEPGQSSVCGKPDVFPVFIFLYKYKDWIDSIRNPKSDETDSEIDEENKDSDSDDEDEKNGTASDGKSCRRVLEISFYKMLSASFIIMVIVLK